MYIARTTAVRRLVTLAVTWVVTWAVTCIVAWVVTWVAYACDKCQHSETTMMPTTKGDQERGWHKASILKT